MQLAENISQEIPRIQSLLKEAEDKLNNFKLSTNLQGLFLIPIRSSRLSSLTERIKEIELKTELSFKKRTSIYVTLIQQKTYI